MSMVSLLIFVVMVKFSSVMAKEVIVSDSLELNEFKYNPERDIQQVEQFGFVDLQKANVTSSIPVVDGLEEERFNGIEDPRSIAGRPSDIFEEMQANKAIVGYNAPSTDSSGEKTE